MHKQIRILHVLGSMGCGGVENLLMNIYRNIDRDKMQFDFLVNSNGVFDEEIKALGGKIFVIPNLKKVGQIVYSRVLMKFFIEHGEYKIVHSHLNQITGLVLECAKKSGVPIRIAHSHSSKSHKNFFVRHYKNYLGNKIKSNATHLFACSDLASMWLFSDRKSEAIIVNNCIEMNNFLFDDSINSKVRREFKIDLDAFVVGHVGRFSIQKNHSFLLDVFNEIQKTHNNSILVLCGDGKFRKDIENKIQDLGIKDKVILTGMRKDVNEIYSIFNILVFPSLYEGLPLTLIEAQINGLKAYCSDTISRQADILNRIQFISLKKDSKEWADIILNSDNKRVSNIDLIKDSGYDAGEVAKELADFYSYSYQEVINKSK